MPSAEPYSWIHFAWVAVGVVGGVLFFGRFYVQWIASELQKQSIVPIAFWYMSSVGSLFLLAYAVWSQSPLGTLSYSLNIVIYVRNLVHIWRERGVLSDRLNIAVHLGAGVVATVAIGFVVRTWLLEYEASQAAHPREAMVSWVWLGVGVVGQALFASRFVVQWIATERLKKSVIPASFWYISLVASLLQAASYTQRGGREMLLAVGVMSTVFIHARNIWFITRHPGEPAPIAIKG